MAVLLDTHVLLWAAVNSPRLTPQARKLVADSREQTYFSVVSLWEVVIKRGIGRPDFRVDPELLRSSALRAGYLELPIRAPHVLAVAALPTLHADPFDRVLISQALTEGFQLLSADRAVISYGSPVVAV